MLEDYVGKKRLIDLNVPINGTYNPITDPNPVFICMGTHEDGRIGVDAPIVLIPTNRLGSHWEIIYQWKKVASRMYAENHLKGIEQIACPYCGEKSS